MAAPTRGPTQKIHCKSARCYIRQVKNNKGNTTVSKADELTDREAQSQEKKMYLVIPGLGLVVDDGRSQAPGRVDAGASDGDGGQVHHEHGEPDWQGSKHLRQRGCKT
jgi:hypothetical protein